MTNDKLPEEMTEQIIADAKRIKRTLIRKTDGDVIYIEGYGEGYVAGATAWALWKVKHDELNGELQKFKETVQYLTIKCDELGVNNHQLQERAGRMADALNEIAESNCDYEDVNFKKLHSTECRACKARELLQQFKDGGKDSVVGKCTKCGRHYPHASISGMCGKCEKEAGDGIRY